MREQTSIVGSRLVRRLPAVATQLLLITGLGALALAPTLISHPQPTLTPFTAQPPPAPTTIVCPPAPANTLGAAHAIAPQSATLIASANAALVSAYPLTSAASLLDLPTPSPSPQGGAPVPHPTAVPIDLTTRDGMIQADAIPGMVVTDVWEENTQHSAGIVLSAASDGDQRSMTAGECMVTRSTAVLVGGSTEIGCSTALTLSNPSAAPVTASLDLLGSTGAIDLPAHGNVVVPPYSTHDVLLESAALRDPRITVSMSTDVGTLGAWLTTSCLNGETPAGTSLISAGSRPATSLLIPGITITDADAAREDLSTDSGPLLRIANTARTQAHVTVHVLSTDDDHILPGGQSIDIAPQAVTDVSLNAMPAGDYAFFLTSDQPIAGAVKLVREGQPYPLKTSPLLTDITWVHSAPTDPSILINPDPTSIPGVETTTRASIANSSPHPVTLTLTPITDGAPMPTSQPTEQSHASEHEAHAEPLDVVIGSQRVKILELNPSVRAYAVSVTAGTTATDDGASTLAMSVLISATTPDPMPGDLLASFQALSTRSHTASESFIPAP